MKNALRTLFLASMLMVTTLTNAQPGRPHLTVMSVASDHQSFWLFIDDMLQNEQPVSSIRVEAIPDGQHYLRVEIDNPEHTTIGQFITLDRGINSYWIDHQRNLYGISIGQAVWRPNAVTRYNLYPGVSTSSSMSEADFSRALDVIRNENFETGKLNSAKHILANNLLTVRQIEEICNLFAYDNTKLDFAESAYNHCTEKEKYYQLFNVFQYDSNKEELRNYISKQEGQ